MIHVETVADFKEELVKRCYILVVIANSNSNFSLLCHYYSAVKTICMLYS